MRKISLIALLTIIATIIAGCTPDYINERTVQGTTVVTTSVYTTTTSEQSTSERTVQGTTTIPSVSVCGDGICSGYESPFPCDSVDPSGAGCKNWVFCPDDCAEQPYE